MDERAMESLVLAATQGDEEAFNELYRRTRNQAYFLAHSITKNEDDALDILQDSYLKAWKNLGKLKEPEKFTAWFNQIAANTAKTFIVKQKPLLFTGEDELLQWEPEREDAYIPHESMDTEETRRLIMDIVYGLPEDQRLAVLLYYYEDMPVADMAAALGIPLNTVKNRLYLARKKISNGVEDLEKNQGVKLFSATPISLLIWMLKMLRLEEHGDKLPPIVLGTAAAGGGGAAAVTLPKIIAAIAAAGIVVGGSVASVNIIRRSQALPVIAETTSAFAAAAEQIISEGSAAFSFPALPALTNGVSAYSDTYTQLDFATQTTAAVNTPATIQTAVPTRTQQATSSSTATAKTTTTAGPTTARTTATTHYNYTAATRQATTQTNPVTAATSTDTTSTTTTTITVTTSTTTTATTSTTAATTAATTSTTTTTATPTIATTPTTTTTAAPATTATPAFAFSYYNDAGNIVIDDYTGAGGVVVIPAIIDGLPVVKIFDQAFQGTAVIEVHIPGGVKEIGRAAFHNCASLTKVVVPASVTALGTGPFTNCPNLTIYCPPGSVTYQHAVQSGIPVA